MPLSLILLILVSVAQAQEAPLVHSKEVRTLTGSADPLVLYARDRSGHPRKGERPATLVLTATESEMRFHVEVSPTRNQTVSPPLTLALIFWDKKATPAPPNVLYAASAPGGETTLSGRVFLAASQGGPHLVRSTDVWQRLGTSASARWDGQTASVNLSLPLAVVAGLCPTGMLLDMRVQMDGALYSHGAAGTWFEAPDPERSAEMRWESAADLAPHCSRCPVQAALEPLLSQRPAQAGPQLWSLLRKPPPLDRVCRKCDEVSRAKELARRGAATAAIEALQPVVSSLSPADPGWQEAMLELQRACLETGCLEKSIETGLRILEADGPWEATVVPALRTLAAALAKAGLKLDGEDPKSAALKLRFLQAVADRNFRAAYGADLLILQDMPGDATVLLEGVTANRFAPAAVRAYALFRLEQLSVHSQDWPRALALAERIQTEVPFDIPLRGASLTLLGRSGQFGTGPGPAGEDPGARLAAAGAKLNADRRAICARYFTDAAGAAAPGFCPFCPGEEK